MLAFGKVPLAAPMESKIKHLEFIQAAINRMAGNSFLLKGWTVTLTGGLLALTFKQTDKHYVFISLAVLVLFSALDSYHLSRERGFVALYNDVRKNIDASTDFSMDTRFYRKQCRWIHCAFSRTILLFYGGLLAVHLLILHFI
jgi:Ni,Fe-hydrogenase I cytochrome b subunit